jgi:hypothetical protein
VALAIECLTSRPFGDCHQLHDQAAKLQETSINSKGQDCKHVTITSRDWRLADGHQSSGCGAPRSDNAGTQRSATCLLHQDLAAIQELLHFSLGLLQLGLYQCTLPPVVQV